MTMANPTAADRFWQVVLIVATLAFCWLAMMIVHEAGHVLHALGAGGGIRKVVLCPWALSRTDVSPNPAPCWIAWGGAVWGVGIPIAIWLAVRRAVPLYEYLAAFFAGFCCVANGAYMGAGALVGAGDAADLASHGAARWPLYVYGIAAVAAGLRFWHGLGPHFGLGASRGRVNRRAACLMVGAAAAIVLWECLCCEWFGDS